MSVGFPVIIYHNPDCETSRNTLGMVRASGYEPVIVEYLKMGWTRLELEGLLAAMGIRPRALLRAKSTPAADLGLLEPQVKDDAIIDAMIGHPILVNRPIVVTPLGTKLCRPSEAVFDLLAKSPASFTKEDGQTIFLVGS